MYSLLRSLARHRSLETLSILLLVLACTTAVFFQIPSGPIRVLSFFMILLLGAGGLTSIFERPSKPSA